MNKVNVGKTSYPLRSSNNTGPVGHSQEQTGTLFHMVDGPPYANGMPHLGHVLNKHLKDAVVRAAHVSGHSTQWRPGWDCHGLPLELLVEKEGVSRANPSVFVERARTVAQHHACAQKEVFEAQGWAADWDTPYHTMDPVMEAGVMRVFATLLEKGFVDVRQSAVPWCRVCQSTLSNAEQEEKTVSRETWVVAFDLGDASVLSWTSTPWTLPLHQHLVVNPEHTYVLLHKEDHRAWVEQTGSHAWAQALGAVVGDTTCLGHDLMGRTYRTPWSEGVIQGDQRVSVAGTGVLHLVAGLSELDTTLAHDNGWVVHQYLQANGTLQKSPLAEQNGMRVDQCYDVVRPYFDSVWFLQQTEQVNVGHCWRHHVPLLTRPSRQVFLRLSDAKEQAMKMVERMTFSPETGRNRLLSFMSNRPDWCVSRQRTWGVPLALFLDPVTQQPHHKSVQWMRDVADMVETQGVQAWWNTDTQTWVGEELVERVDDVLDVWFDSGCVPQLLGTSDVVVEGTDQHRGWFQSCLWLAAMMGEELPFRHVVTHGFVMGANKEKLSKSKGGDQKGVVAWNTLPTDVVRVWALMGSDGADKQWSAETVGLAQSYVARMRGVLRFMLANRTEFAHPENMSSWDRYWWSKTQLMRDQVLGLCLKGQTGAAMSALMPFAETFSSVVMNSWKDRLYCADQQSALYQSMQYALQQCLLLWADMLEVFTPRLRMEAQEYMPTLTRQLALDVTDEEATEVEQVLKMRDALGVVMEQHLSHVPNMQRRLVWLQAPSWQGQLLADALDVGQTHTDTTDLTHVLEDVWVGVSSDAVCPRCRRCQPAWSGEACC